MLVGILYPLDFSLWSVAFLGGYSLNPQGDGEKPTLNSLGCQDYVMPDCLELKVVNDRGEVIWAFFVGVDGWWWVLGGKSDGKVHHLPHWNTHEWLIRWFLWDHCRQIYAISRWIHIESIIFSLQEMMRKQELVLFHGHVFFFFWGGWFLVIHWNQPTHLWGVAWLTCLWSPLVCITRCFLFKERSMRPHFCLQLFKHETCIDTGVPMIQLWLTAWLINWVAPKNHSPPPRKHNECSPELRDPFKKKKLVFYNAITIDFCRGHSFVFEGFSQHFSRVSTRLGSVRFLPCKILIGQLRGSKNVDILTQLAVYTTYPPWN